MGTKINPGEFDCYNNAEPDEPHFTLLARDTGAPDLVRLWAARREINQEAPEVVAEARACADAMEEWRAIRVNASPAHRLWGPREGDAGGTDRD